MEVKLVTHKADLELLQPQLTKLYRQLNPELAQLPLETILEAGQSTDVAVCLDGKVLVGIALMARYKVISGHKGMIEDVVVAEAHRGKGIGKKLMGLLLEEAQKQGLDDVLLFSGHHRTAAIAMYKGLGFTLKNSGLYIKKMNV
jgi:ribosomal protein S18 acetylase RimI-like enzyme